MLSALLLFIISKLFYAKPEFLAIIRYIRIHIYINPGKLFYQNNYLINFV